MHSGARQYRHGCECADSDRQIMHSEVSQANAEFFISENRLRNADLDEDDLRDILEGTSGSIIVCNPCGRIKEVGVDDDQDDVHRGLDQW